MTARIAVLASGGGSNLQAILDYNDTLGLARSGDVVLVASNRATAPALARARRHGIPAEYLPSPDAPTLLALLSDHSVEIVVLAGYLKLVPADVTERYRGRIINVHPGPLPQFGGPGMYGHHVHAAVLAAGVSHSGVTVHLVDDHFDQGNVISHWPVPILPGDTPESLGARVLEMEHIVYPRTVDTLAATVLAQESRS